MAADPGNGTVLAAVLSTALLATPAPWPEDAHAPPDSYCFTEAAREYGVDRDMLIAIAWHESHFLAWKVRRNTDGSVDYGLMQINSRNLPALRLDERSVMPACVNIRAAARLYRRAIAHFGNTWAAVGAYHSTTPPLQRRYAEDVAQRYVVVRWLDQRWSALRALWARLVGAAPPD